MKQTKKMLCPECGTTVRRPLSIEEQWVVHLTQLYGSLPNFKQILWLFSQTCAICGLKIDSIDDATIDHILPTAKGGTNHRNNRQLAHAKCNSLKGDDPDYVHPAKAQAA